MGRTFLVLALANDAIAEPDRRAVDLATIDRILDDTLARERDEGMHAFLLPYGRRAPFVDPSGRSIFVDGEIALMLAARQTIAPDPAIADELRETLAADVDRLVEMAPEVDPELWPSAR